MKVSIAATSSGTLAYEPRRMAWRVMMPKNTSTRLSQEPEVGVKCSVIRGLLRQPGLDVGVLVGVVVVEHDVQLGARVGPRDVLEEVRGTRPCRAAA